MENLQKELDNLFFSLALDIPTGKKQLKDLELNFTGDLKNLLRIRILFVIFQDEENKIKGKYNRFSR